MKRFIYFLFVATVVFDAAVQAQLATNHLVLAAEYLSALSEEMRTNNPALRAAQSRTAAAEANVAAVRTWEDPMARVGGTAAEREMRMDDGDVAYGVEQKLPLFGRPKWTRRVAAAEATTELARSEFQFQQMRAEFARTAFRTALASEVVAIAEEDLAWLELMRRTMDSKYEAGQATLVEVLQISNEHGRRTTSLQTERDRLGAQRVTLNRFLGRGHDAAWPDLRLPEVAGPVVFNEKLVEFALRYEPKILVIREQIRQAAAAVEVARRGRFPEIGVGLEARQYSGDGDFRQGMLVFSTSLPWVNGRKYREDVKRERANLRATEFELEDYQAALREEVHLLTVKIDAAQREALLYRDEILPRTRATMETVRAGWEANRGTVREMIEARRMWLEARLMYARAVAEQYEMMSDLVLCCGLGDLAALQMLGAIPEAANPAGSPSQ
ncbi:MAG TPA: TolC family protein [Verrucomicrobiae bacterium]|nr:TolC family protein [Verrucomicrobiae bacterium]